jgi:FkbM family methyltransferase
VVAHVSTPLVHGMDARVEVEIADGVRILADTTQVIGRSLATSGVWEPHVTAVVRTLLAPGDVAVDVGANVGYFTLLAAGLVGPEGRVHALEPSPATFAELTENVVRNGLRNVRAERLAAGAGAGEETLFEVSGGSNVGASSIRRHPGSHRLGAAQVDEVPVHVAPLADVVPRDEWPRLALVKIDVEGFESDVLAGLEPIFAAGHRPAIAVEVHADIDPAAAGTVANVARRHGLRIRRILEHPDAERLWASRHPRLEDVDPSEIEAIRDLRFDLLVTARAA